MVADKTSHLYKYNTVKFSHSRTTIYVCMIKRHVNFIWTIHQIQINFVCSAVWLYSWAFRLNCQISVDIIEMRFCVCNAQIHIIFAIIFQFLVLGVGLFLSGMSNYYNTLSSHIFTKWIFDSVFPNHSIISLSCLII